MDQAKPRDRTHFFSRAALLMLALVLASFSFTYFTPIATGRTAWHRELFLAGIALSALMVPLSVAIAIKAARRRTAAGNAHPFNFTLFNVVDLVTFAILMIASIGIGPGIMALAV